MRDVLRVHARAGLVDTRAVEVGGEDLDRQPAAPGLGELGESDGDGVGLLAGGAPRHPDPQRIVPGAVLEQLGQDPGFERLERLRVAEEARDVDQDVLVEGLHLAGVFPQMARVVPQPVHLVQHHAAGDAAVESACLVLAEVDVRSLAQDLQDLAEIRRVRGRFAPGRRGSHQRMPGDARDLLGDPVRGKHEVHAAAGDGAARHAGLLRRVVLGEGDAAFGLDLLQPQGAVGGGAGENHPDRPVLLVIRQGTEE